MKTLWRIVGLAFAALIFAASFVMVTEYGMTKGDTARSGFVVAVIGIAAILYSMVGIMWSRQMRREGRDAVAKLIIAGMVISEGYILYAEAGWWGQNIKASEQRQKAYSVAAGVNFAKVERDQETIERLKKARGAERVNADIALELAKPVEIARGVERPLGLIAKGCNEPSSTYYSKCEKVLELRRELADAEEFAKARFEVGTTVVEDIIVKPINAGAKMLAEVTPFKEDHLVSAGFLLGLAFLMFGRITLAPAIFGDRRNEAGEREKPAAAEAVKTVRIEPEVAQLLQPGPVAQIPVAKSALKTPEAPETKEEKRNLAPSSVPAKDDPKEEEKDGAEDGPKEADSPAHCSAQKRPGKKVASAQIIDINRPFLRGGAKPGTARTPREFVIAFCGENEGKTVRFSDIYAELKKRGGKRTPMPKPVIGAILAELGHTRSKPGNAVHYTINARRDAAAG